MADENIATTSTDSTSNTDVGRALRLRDFNDSNISIQFSTIETSDLAGDEAKLLSYYIEDAGILTSDVTYTSTIYGNVAFSSVFAPNEYIVESATN